MVNNNKRLIIIATVVILTNLYAVTWPVASTDPNHPQPQVAMTYGDWHGGGPAEPFHRAIDIPSRGGTKILAIANGSGYAWNEGPPRYLWNFTFDTYDAKRWDYCHLYPEPDDNIYYYEGDEIQNTAIADYPWSYGFDDHLHLIYGDYGNPADNPLLYLPYSDPGNKTPFVWFPEIFIYNRACVKNVNGKLWWLYPTYAGQPTPKIYDYVDIIAKAQDDMNGTLENGNKVYTGVYEPGFWITDIADNSVLGPLFLHTFSGPLPSGDKFDAFFSKENPSSNWHDFYYIVTDKEGDATKCWATKARSGGQSENDPKARINAEAVFPDKEYKIWLINKDAANHLSQEVAFVCLDNFKPYVQFVQIGQEEKVVKYEAHWPTTPVSDYDLGALIIDVDDHCKAGKLLTFLIEFSEDMKTDVLPSLQVQFPDGTIKTVPSGEWMGSNVYRAVTG
ncbi:MAG: hypothetical protein PHX54_13515, partial [Lentimicrobiaceae bacterium]|nr:hypothetical protein [Lentimicrobiaceae bacterium]